MLVLKELSECLRGKGYSVYNASKIPQSIKLFVVKVVVDVILFSTRLHERMRRRGQEG